MRVGHGLADEAATQAATQPSKRATGTSKRQKKEVTLFSLVRSENGLR
ncbi:hypothetical protein RBSH_05347 [Rhodopirellula baltica SH28]|uniref:Uncharacterized protein n=1 Tax=Rhodopirellula baltica SH28 TaxID=993517 RepID=K5D927_RHOBT|nr:hypothetical protein RBSH_05347 [Rhodopirellula baltica SH28]